MAAPRDDHRSPGFMGRTSASVARAVRLSPAQTQPKTPRPVELGKRQTILSSAKARFGFGSSSLRKDGSSFKAIPYSSVSPAPAHPRNQQNTPASASRIPTRKITRTISSSPIPGINSPHLDKPLPSSPIATIKGESQQNRRFLIDAAEKPLHRTVSHAPGTLTQEKWPVLSPVKAVGTSLDDVVKQTEEAQVKDPDAKATCFSTTQDLFAGIEDNKAQLIPQKELAVLKRSKPKYSRTAEDLLQIESPLAQRNGSTATQVLPAEAAGSPLSAVDIHKMPPMVSETYPRAQGLPNSSARVPSLEQAFNDMQLTPTPRPIVRATKTSAARRRLSKASELSLEDQKKRDIAATPPNPFRQKIIARKPVGSAPTFPRRNSSLAGRAAARSPIRTSSPFKPACGPIRDSPRLTQVDNARFSPYTKLPKKSPYLTTGLGDHQPKLLRKKSSLETTPITPFVGASLMTPGGTFETNVSSKVIDQASKSTPTTLGATADVLNECEEPAKSITAITSSPVADDQYSLNLTEDVSSTDLLLGTGAQNVAEEVDICSESDLASLGDFELSKQSSRTKRLSINAPEHGPVLRISSAADRMLLGLNTDADFDGESTKRVKHRKSLPTHFMRQTSQIKETLRKSVSGLPRSLTAVSLDHHGVDNANMEKLDEGKGEATPVSTNRGSTDLITMADALRSQDDSMSDTNDLNLSVNPITSGHKQSSSWPLPRPDDLPQNTATNDDEDWISPLKSSAAIPSTPAPFPVPNNTPATAKSNSKGFVRKLFGKKSRDTGVHQRDAASSLVRAAVPSEPMAFAHHVLDLARESADAARRAALLSMGETLVTAVTAAKEAEQESVRAAARAERAAFLAAQAVKEVKRALGLGL